MSSPKRHDTIMGVVFEGIFFRMIQVKDKLSFKYCGVYRKTSDRYINEGVRHKFPVQSLVIVNNDEVLIP